MSKYNLCISKKRNLLTIALKEDFTLPHLVQWTPLDSRWFTWVHLESRSIFFWVVVQPNYHTKLWKDDHSNRVEGEGAKLGQWLEIEEELVLKMKEKGIQGQGGKKAPIQRYIIWYYLLPAHPFLRKTAQDQKRMLPRKPCPNLTKPCMYHFFISFIPIKH